MSVDNMSVDKMSVDKMSVDKMSVDKMSADEMTPSHQNQNLELFYFVFQQISIRWTYKLMWPETRMILNSSADWSSGEINVRGDMVEHFW